MSHPEALAAPPRPGRTGLSLRLRLLAGLAYLAFVVGGFAFGAVLVANLQALSQTGSDAGAGPTAPAIGLPSAAGGLGLPAVGGIRPEAVLPDWKGRERVNILLLGIDQRPDESADQARSDTMLVLSVDPVAKTAALISFPRDLWVEIPGYGENKINVAHPLGGPKLAARTIERNFGLKVHYYARVDFGGFEDIVDQLGGVLVDVERPVKDDEYPTENYGAIRIYIPPGPQMMHGQTALHFARSRHSDNDFGRMRRQQQVLLAIRDRALKLDVLPRLPGLIGLAQKMVSTDLGPTEMLALAKLGASIQRDQITSLVIDGQYADATVNGQGLDVLIPHRAEIQRAIELALAGRLRQSPPARVEVLNGSSRPGIALQTGEYLRELGYEVVRVDTADRSDYRESAIQVLTGKTEAASELASILRLPTTAIELRPAAGAAVDLRVILGQTFQVPGQ